MPRDVIMPALGMAQDKGVIVAWRKKPGDEVKADDVLMEIETDKATMEVEAGHAGFVAELRAGEGDAVPVGDVVAVISETADGAKDRPTATRSIENASASAEETDAPNDEAKEPAPAKAKPEPAAKSRPPAAKAITRRLADHGRLLASPKAKYQAAQRNIDLEALIRQGVREPIHAADLDLYRPEPAAGAVHWPSVLSAHVARDAFETFAAWAEGESDGAASRARMLAAFAAGAWRRVVASDREAAVILVVSAPMADEVDHVWRDPDFGGLADELECANDETPAFSLFDLTGSGLSDYRSGRSDGAALVFADDPTGYRLSLHFDEADISLSRAARLLSGFSERIADPLRQLL